MYRANYGTRIIANADAYINKKIYFCQIKKNYLLIKYFHIN